ncbi:GLPGLI family protein [Proteiniphilum sp.]|uniref:GLPGLI family protein n=1 Tax=Proteiniphilum sp. TaxID=1926877 RepID=UPI003322E4D5
MKRALILFFLPLILAQVVFSQEKIVDYAHLKCQYQHTYLKDTLDVGTYNDLFILQIGKNISKWYSYYTFQMDSLRRTPDGKQVWQEMFNKSLEVLKNSGDRTKWMNSFPHNGSRTFVYKNNPSGKMTVTDGIGNDHLIYQDTLNAQHWQIADSMKTILGYECQKAECDFRGRHWTAWFSPDIPVSDGPWKLGGLPGLILEAYDVGKQYHFWMVGLEAVTREPIVFSEFSLSKGKFREIDRRELLKLEMNQLTNMGAIMEAETGVPSGNNKPVYRDLIERDYK